MLGSLEEVVQFFGQNKVATVVSAFPTPSNFTTHMGTITGILYQDFMLRFIENLGIETYFTFGAHPTGINVFSLVRSVLVDMHKGVSSESQRFGFSPETLQDIADRNPALLDYAGKMEGNEIEIADAVHGAAQVIVPIISANYSSQIELYNIDSSRFMHTFTHTIEPSFQAFTRWQIDRLDERGMLKVIKGPAPYCTLGQHAVDVTDDQVEAVFKEGANKVVRSPEGLSFKGEVRCKEHNHPLVFRDVAAISVDYPTILERAVDDLGKRYSDGRMFTTPHSWEDMRDILLGTEPKKLLRSYLSNLGTEVNLSHLLDSGRRTVVEPLGDSNIYWIFYPIAELLNSKALKPEYLTSEFFDYMFLAREELESKGITANKVANSINEGVSLFRRLNAKTLEDAREYVFERMPIVLNIFGREHDKVHGRFSMLWPYAIGLEHFVYSGWLSYGLIKQGGMKMSKSQGNIKTPEEAVQIASSQLKQDTNGWHSYRGINLEKVAADAVRFYLLADVDSEQDVDWKDEALNARIGQLSRLFNRIQLQKRLYKGAIGRRDEVDRWMESRLCGIIEQYAVAVGNHRFTEASEMIFSQTGMQNDFNKYIEYKRLRGKNLNKVVLDNYFSVLSQMSEPFIPYVSDLFLPRGVKRTDLCDHCMTRDLTLEERFRLFLGYSSIRELMEQPGDVINRGDMSHLKQVWLEEVEPIVKNVIIDLNRNKKRSVRTAVVYLQSETDYQILKDGLNLGTLNEYITTIRRMAHVDMSPRYSVKVRYEYAPQLEKRFGVDISYLS